MCDAEGYVIAFGCVYTNKQRKRGEQKPRKGNRKMKRKMLFFLFCFVSQVFGLDLGHARSSTNKKRTSSKA